MRSGCGWPVRWLAGVVWYEKQVQESACYGKMTRVEISWRENMMRIYPIYPTADAFKAGRWLGTSQVLASHSRPQKPHPDSI